MCSSVRLETWLFAFLIVFSVACSCVQVAVVSRQRTILWAAAKPHRWISAQTTAAVKQQRSLLLFPRLAIAMRGSCLRELCCADLELV